MKILVACVLVALSVGAHAAEKTQATAHRLEVSSPLVIEQVSISRTMIAFSLAGDIWLVSRSGGSARQLTSGPDEDTDPFFSPDGTQIAFTRTSSGNSDVYVSTIGGGGPSRLTFHPASDLARGWSPDGKNILFSSPRGLPVDRQLYLIPACGGVARMLPIPLAKGGAYTADGSGLVYVQRDPSGRYQLSWKGYRGGATGLLRYADLKSGAFRQLSDGVVNDISVTRAGNRFVIESDRDGGIYNLFLLDEVTGAAEQLTHFEDTGLGAIAGAPDGVVAYERNGILYTLDLGSRATRRIPLKVALDLRETKLRKVHAADWLSGAAVSNRGDMAFEARGDILLLHEGHSSQNVTSTSGANDRSPIFSPDGSQLAYLSDAKGDEDLYVRTWASGKVRRVALPGNRGGFQELSWSPDGHKILLSDQRLTLHLVDLDSQQVSDVETSRHTMQSEFKPVWSPDSQWVAYAKYQANNNRVIILYDVRDKVRHVITDETIDADNPVFDSKGRYLYFISSENAGAVEALGMRGAAMRPLALREIQAIALHKGDRSPFATNGPEPPAPTTPLSAKLDFAGMNERIWQFPDKRDYARIASIPEGLLVTAREWPSTPAEGSPHLALYKLGTSGAPALAKLEDSIDRLFTSPDGSKSLSEVGDEWKVRDTARPDTSRVVDISAATVAVNPAQEWRNLYHQTWRQFRALFYDPTFHGQDLTALERRYEAYLPHVTRRADLNTLLRRAVGNLSVSHLSFVGGDIPKVAGAKAGATLGADFDVAENRFRFSRIYRPHDLALPMKSRSPFNGTDVEEGDYVISIDGEDVRPTREIFSYLVGAAGRRVALTVARDPAGRNARTVMITPLSGDGAIRQAAWVESNRDYVERHSNGTVGYVYLPDFEESGTNAFLQQWIAATDKSGVVLDQRYNPGGIGGDLVFDYVDRRPLAEYAFRDSDYLPFPVIGVRGPRVLLIHEFNGSSSDVFPWLFRAAHQGTIVGTRTAGWAVGSWLGATFQDGGEYIVPMRAFFNPAGTWDIENQGVAPDLTVVQDPRAVLEGRDPQLEEAVDVVLRDLEQKATLPPQRPAPLVFPRNRSVTRP